MKAALLQSLLQVRDWTTSVLCSPADLPAKGFSNQIPLVARGNCTFYEKVRLAQGSGARGLLIISKETLVRPPGPSWAAGGPGGRGFPTCGLGGALSQGSAGLRQGLGRSSGPLPEEQVVWATCHPLPQALQGRPASPKPRAEREGELALPQREGPSLQACPQGSVTLPPDTRPLVPSGRAAPPWVGLAKPSSRPLPLSPRSPQEATRRSTTRSAFPWPCSATKTCWTFSR